VKPLKALRESLGVINDAAMATRRGEELARGGHLELDVPVGVLASSRMKASRAAMRKLRKQWARYEEQNGFWRCTG
jgi:hypothetical protein